MVVVEFPPIDFAREDGLLAFGGDAEPASILLAYRQGIFPWPIGEDVLTWFAPPERAILFCRKFHRSKTLQRKLRTLPYEVKVNSAFEEVIKRCAELVNRGDQSGTWITRDILDGYIALHKEGSAHSIECFEGSELIGGLYGVSIGSYFSAESMFYRKPYASQFALDYLVRTLEAQGVNWIDCQVVSPFLEKIGAQAIPRSEFMDMLKESLSGSRISLY